MLRARISPARFTTAPRRILAGPFLTRRATMPRSRPICAPCVLRIWPSHVRCVWGPTTHGKSLSRITGRCSTPQRGTIVAERGEAYARDLADSLYAELYGLDSSGAVRRRSLLEYFHGRSKLATWLRTVLAQRYVDALRATRRMEPLPDVVSGAGPRAMAAATPAAMALEMEDSAEHGSRGSGSAIRAQASLRSANFGREFGDPDRARLMPRLRDALLAAFALLAPCDRMLLSLYYLDNLKLAHIARMRRVHEATISRQLERIRRELRESVKRMLATDRAAENGCAARQKLTAAEIELCFTYVLEDWAFDLSQALRENGPATTTRHHDAGQHKEPA